ncbi:MAG TPA: hypothetical protein VMP67_08190 [Candidatus Limnocylindria bacterium]|nr:hypothetical protein [Candidatus Limnocylindria bacterium]
MSLSGSPLDTVVLGSGAIELTVLPQRGARLHRLRVDGHDLLRTPADVRSYDDEPFYWGAFVMAPWCNRLAAGPLEVAGQTVDLPISFRDGTAIHGQVYARPWRQQGESVFEVEAGGKGWPWPCRVRLELELESAGLTIVQSIVNLADDAMPAGLGLHPWFVRPVEVAVHAPSVFTSNNASSPQPEPVTGKHDLRRLGRMTPDLDATWADPGEPPVELRWPADGRVCRLTAGSNRGNLFITAASPSDVDAVAVEPQTHAPQGLRRLLNGEPGALQLIEPGGSLVLTTRLSFEQRNGESRA